MEGRKILIENPLIWGGGCETMLQSIVEYFKDDYSFTVLTRPAPDELFPAAKDPCVRWIKKHTGWKPYKRFTLRWFVNRIACRVDDLYYALLMSAEHFDIAISMSEGPGMRHVDRIRAKRKFAWIQKDFRYLHNSAKHFASDRHELECMKRFEKIICVSETAKQGVIETIGDPGNLCVCYNPIDAMRIRRLSEEKADPGHGRERPLLITVGRLDEVKNIPLLLKSCVELRKELAFDLWIVGDGPEREKIEGLIREEKMEFVQLLGSRVNPYPLMKQADLYVSASYSESYGLSIQEALILGVPVVAVRNPAVEEVFDERFGIMTENETEGIRESIRRMLADPSVTERYRENIDRFYPIGDLYEKRFAAIRNVWETGTERT